MKLLEALCGILLLIVSAMFALLIVLDRIHPGRIHW